jgi:hypothetical protein
MVVHVISWTIVGLSIIVGAFMVVLAYKDYKEFKDSDFN